MDGTLLDLGYDKHFWEEHLPRRFAESRGIAISEAHRLMQPIFESTAGTLDWYCVNYWSRALALDIELLASPWLWLAINLPSLVVTALYLNAARHGKPSR